MLAAANTATSSDAFTGRPVAACTPGVGRGSRQFAGTHLRRWGGLRNDGDRSEPRRMGSNGGQDGGQEAVSPPTREHGHPPNSRPSLNVTESWGCRTTAVLWTAKCQDHEPRIRTYADQALKHAKSYESESKQAKVDGARQAVSAPRQRYLYRTLLTEVYKIHTARGGHCKVCNSRYPRGTTKVLEGASGSAGDAIVRAAARRDHHADLDPD